MGAKKRGSLVLIDKFSLLGVVREGDDGLLEEVSEVVAVFGSIVCHGSHLSVDLGEQFELSLQILDYLSVEGAEHQRLLGLEGRVQGGVDLQDLLGVSQREEHHQISYNNIERGSGGRGVESVSVGSFLIVCNNLYVPCNEQGAAVAGAALA